MRRTFFAGILFVGACVEDGIRFGELVLDTGLSGSDTAAPSVSGVTCDRIQMDGTCSEFVGSGWDPDDIATDCNATLSSAPCPVSDALGTCTIDPYGVLTIERTFYVGPYYSTSDASLVGNGCVLSGGLWSAP